MRLQNLTYQYYFSPALFGPLHSSIKASSPSCSFSFLRVLPRAVVLVLALKMRSHRELRGQGAARPKRRTLPPKLSKEGPGGPRDPNFRERWADSGGTLANVKS